MRTLICGFLLVVAIALIGCGGGDRKQRVKILIEAKPAHVQGGEIDDNHSNSKRSVGEIVSVWLTSPFKQQLEYDPKTYVASGVVLVEVGENILFRVEAKRQDGVTIYSGETRVSITVEEQFKKIEVSLFPVTGSVNIIANVHEITGPPSIRLTYVPPLGSFDDLQGVVENINPALVAVAVYIEVDGLWWTKPYWSAPKTPVRSDGKWVCDITTGGHDQDATRIRAYLIRKDYDPPLAPSQGLPPDPPTPDVLAMVEVRRE